jgi:hypothetical protein
MLISDSTRGVKAPYIIAICAWLGLSSALSGCADTPAAPVPYKRVAQDRIALQAIAKPSAQTVAVDVRRERSSNVVVRFRNVVVYVDGAQVSNLENGEDLVVYLPAGMHRLGVSTQFDPVAEIGFTVDSHYTNIASVTFDGDHRVTIRRVPH